MNPYDEENSEPNFWLSCMIIDPEAMCKQVRGEQEALYISEPGKSCPTEILETLVSYNVEGRPNLEADAHAADLPDEWICHKRRKWTGKDKCLSCRRSGRTGWKTLDVGMDLFHRGLCLPSDNKMTVEEQEKVIEIVKRCFE